MKKNAYSIDALSSVVSSDAFAALKEMMEDLDLEIIDVISC